MTIQAKVIDVKGKSTGEMGLSEAVFGIKPYNHLVYDTVIAQLASRRQGTAKTKTRSEVRGSGKKPYKQKGTGNARRGSNRSPLMVGGGVVFGPRPRKYDIKLPNKVVNQAIRVALSNAQREGKIFVVKDFSIENAKTKNMATLLKGLNITKSLVIDSGNEKLGFSVRNLKSSKYLEVEGINVFDLLKYQNIIISSKALKKLEERLGA